jgi:hypothetical protein
LQDTQGGFWLILAQKRYNVSADARMLLVGALLSLAGAAERVGTLGMAERVATLEMAERVATLGMA